MSEPNGGSHHFVGKWSYIIVCTTMLDTGNGSLYPNMEVINKKFDDYDKAEAWSKNHEYSNYCTHEIAQLVNFED